MDPQARVIIGSADIQSSTRRLVDEAGAVAFINKPFTVDQVLNAVNRALEGDENGIN
jgi:two-component system chemotaxis response regulator CheY